MKKWKIIFFKLLFLQEEKVGSKDQVNCTSLMITQTELPLSLLSFVLFYNFYIIISMWLLSSYVLFKKKKIGTQTEFASCLVSVTLLFLPVVPMQSVTAIGTCRQAVWRNVDSYASCFKVALTAECCGKGLVMTAEIEMLLSSS